MTAKANLSRLRPLLFLNGCDTGRGGFSLTGLGGWAQQSLEAGAGAFLGTLWPVRDRKARAFASAFYRVFLGGAPIADAVRQARLHVREQFPGDPAWLAYTVYAFPEDVCASTPRMTVKQVPQHPLLKVPELVWSEGSSPGQLLQAEYGVVPFHGRQKEGDDLYAWCMEGQPVRVRLYTGPGGMGKTRLAIEIAKRLRREGWLAGFLDQESQELWQEISWPAGKLLAVVDYAETRRELLLPLLRHLADFGGTGPVRLILLARAALDWWEQLKTEEKGVGALLSGPATTRHSLPPLALRLQDRIESHHLAGRSFAERLGKPSPAKISEGLEAEFFERVLFLHMAAYVELQGKKQARSEDDIYEMLRHEGRYWKKRAVDDKKLAESLVPGIRRAMAAITLGGGVHGETETVEILRRLHAFQGHTGDVLLEVAHLLHECYPGNNRWIEPILPDLLGEHLVQREMERGADELLNLILGPSSADGGVFDDPRS